MLWVEWEGEPLVRGSYLLFFLFHSFCLRFLLYFRSTLNYTAYFFFKLHGLFLVV